jgi:hypothetical protein
MYDISLQCVLPTFFDLRLCGVIRWRDCGLIVSERRCGFCPHGLRVKTLHCGQCGQRIINPYELLENCKVAVSNGRNTHECSHPTVWRAIEKWCPHCPHCPQMPAHGHGHMATWSWPASPRVMWTLPTLPPTKVLHCKDCKHRAAVAICFLAEGPRGGP